MKITIAYLPEEERSASLIQAFLRRFLEPRKIRHSDQHPPFKHIYITSQAPAEGPREREEPEKT